jgi:hypothetical protein
MKHTTLDLQTAPVAVAARPCASIGHGYADLRPWSALEQTMNVFTRKTRHLDPPT